MIKLWQSDRLEKGLRAHLCVCGCVATYTQSDQTLNSVEDKKREESWSCGDENLLEFASKKWIKSKCFSQMTWCHQKHID